MKTMQIIFKALWSSANQKYHSDTHIDINLEIKDICLTDWGMRRDISCWWWYSAVETREAPLSYPLDSAHPALKSKQYINFLISGIFASGNFCENDAWNVRQIFTESYFRYFKDSQWRHIAGFNFRYVYFWRFQGVWEFFAWVEFSLSSRTPWNPERTFNDKAYTSPHLFGQFFNFCIFIKFFLYEVKKPSKFYVSGPYLHNKYQ